MDAMLALIPLLVLFGLYLIFSDIDHEREIPRGPAGNLVLAAVSWGLMVALGSELLSLFHALTRAWVAVFWIVAAVPIYAVIFRQNTFRSFRQQLGEVFGSLDLWGRMLFIALILLSTVLLIIAFVSPPNNVDSFLYHMARVVHWTQNQSLEHYSAYIDHQLNKPIWAETAILQLRILWGNDRPANLIQWLSMVGSVIVVAGIAGLLGASKRGRLLASIFAFTVPMGILQATSTQNDYVTTFWVICMAYLVVLGVKRKLSNIEIFSLMSVFGLGILTKGVFFVYFPPLLFWYFLNELRSRGWIKTFILGLLTMLVVLALNLGFWARNIRTYGGPYGTSDWLQRNLGFNVDFLNQLFEQDDNEMPPGAQENQPRIPGSFLTSGVNFPQTTSDSFPVSRDGQSRLRGMLSNYLRQLARTVGRNFTNPFGIVTDRLIAFVEGFPGLFGENYGAELKASAWNHEDHAGNLHHLLVIIVMVVLVPFAARGNREFTPLYYALAVLVTYLLLPVVIGHAESYWGIRYQLPFFILAAPLFGYLLSTWEKNWIQLLLGGGLLLAALPWLLLNNTRPLIGMPPWPTKIESIFSASQEEILLANNPALVDDYRLTSEAIRDYDCSSVGLIVDQSFLEYPLWWFLDAPQGGTHIQVILAEDNPFRIDDFEPCAVVCTSCAEQKNIRGLDDMYHFDTLRVFLEHDGN